MSDRDNFDGLARNHVITAIGLKVFIIHAIATVKMEDLPIRYEVLLSRKS